MLSDWQAHLVSDIAGELNKAFKFIGNMGFDEFEQSDLHIYAVQKAVQNAVEAAIQLERDRNIGKFASTFPNHTLKDYKQIADAGRHDYRRFEVLALWNALHKELQTLMNDAEHVLAAERTARGH